MQEKRGTGTHPPSCPALPWTLLQARIPRTENQRSVRFPIHSPFLSLPHRLHNPPLPAPPIILPSLPLPSPPLSAPPIILPLPAPPIILPSLPLPLLELASSGCLSVYHWNGGGVWNSRPWTQDLPSDPQVYNTTVSTQQSMHYVVRSIYGYKDTLELLRTPL